MPNKVKFSSVYCKSYRQKYHTTTWDKFSQNFQGRKIKTKENFQGRKKQKLQFSGGNCKLYQTKNKTKKLILKDHKKETKTKTKKQKQPKKCTQCNTHIQKIGEKCEHCHNQSRTEEVFRFCTQSQSPFKIKKKVKMTFN